MRLFLWGAPCADTIAEQQMLMARGYDVVSLVDIRNSDRAASPRDLKRLRALCILESQAVVVVDHDSRSSVMECAAVCRALGVPMVLGHELPGAAPHPLRMAEVIDACDRSFQRPCTSNVVMAQPRVQHRWRRVAQRLAGFAIRLRTNQLLHARP